ncbi:O-antigen ligase family protein [Neobacillus sp. NRS-1170]|uniref:O-antigen ligase family protein n=1 Tax=Neobacillus sp. NRS-1170 TaxID=3233898 RepID=UPI003D2CF3C7
MYFLFLSVVTVAAAIFYTPYKFGIPLDLNSTIKEYIKLAAVSMYMLGGYNFIQEKMVRLSLKWYSYAALFTGILGIFIYILGMKFLFRIYNFGIFDRYNGFMNDPNYFAIIQISALPYFLRSKNISLKAKIITYAIMMLSIFLSGSKTGFITLIIYSILFGLGEVFKNKMRLRTILFWFSAILFLSILSVAILLIGSNLNLNLDKFVQFQRISLLFTNFDEAINGNGSSRLPIWMAGIHLISLSPLFGVGIGMYPAVSEKIAGIEAVAHNTYIQVYSEWGGLFATILFMYLAAILLKVTIDKKIKNVTNFVLRDILIILLIGSIAISLNNSRMFWFFLGVLACRISEKQQTKLQSRIIS